MKYAISKMTVPLEGVIEISEDEFTTIRQAREYLLEAYYLEEKFDLLCENFFEYELELLKIATRAMIFTAWDELQIIDDRLTICRRIVNVLTSCRLYIDQSCQHLSFIFGKNSEPYTQIQQNKKQHYDESLSYRAMEKLRNFSQHNGFPIQMVSYTNSRIQIDGDDKLLYRFIPGIKLGDLERNNKFNKSVLNELKLFYSQDEIDIRPLMREYIERIGSTHLLTRSLLKILLAKWENIYEDTYTKFSDYYGNQVNRNNCTIVILNEDDIITERYSISPKVIEHRLFLEEKNYSLKNIHKCFSSSEVRNEDQK